MKDLNKFLQDKIMDCEEVFENANTNSDRAFLQGLLKDGWELTVVLMNIGKRQAYTEILDYIKRMEE